MRAGFNTSIKGKIFAIVLVSLAALVSAYFVNKFAFGAIRHSVEDLSHANKKLIAVNNIFFEINASEQLFRKLITSEGDVTPFVRQSRRLQGLTDSLKRLSIGNSYQVAMIDSISALLDKRQQVLLNYVDFRRRLNNTNPLLTHAEALDSLFALEALAVDSIVYSNEQHKSIIHSDTVLLQTEQRTRGLLRRIFGPKKPDSIKVNTVVLTENNSMVDTVVQVRPNNILVEAQRIIEEISQEQVSRRKAFRSRETALNNFESTFHNQITHLLEEIEKGITYQTNAIHSEAERSIGGSISRILIILGCFVFFSLIFVLLLLSDITKSNRYRLLLEEARTDAERQSLYWQGFLSNMSHEIRTPLQAIIGYSEQMIKQEHTKDSPMEIIHDSSEHLLQVINEILDYNRISSGKFSFEQLRFNMRDVIFEIINLMQLPANKKGLQLVSNEQDIPGNCFLEGDPFRLKQVLLNLLGNAIKFTDKGKVELQVTLLSDKDNQVAFTFEVCDTGPGIPAEEQEVIFNRFETATLAPDRQYQGSGLGLSITKALIEGQGGVISLASEPGKGACFTCHLTYAKSVATGLSQRPEQVALSSAGARVWQVDDDRLILQLCSRILEQQGVAHTCFHTAAALLAEPVINHPTMFLVDIRMLEINGFQLYDELRKRFPKNIPVIAVTAQALPEERYEILAYGFNDILLKPFREEQLLSMIGKWTKRAKTATPAGPPQENAVSWDDEILQAFIVETEQDIYRLEGESADPEVSAMMLHRLAGRTAQVGYKDLGRKLRKLERAVRESGSVDRVAVAAVIEELRAVLHALKS